MRDVIRRLVFRPYPPGAGPTFHLAMWDTGRRDGRGQNYLGYRLVERSADGRRQRVIFEGEDFAGSPLHADDSRDTVSSLMHFLTIRPGDTDREYFLDYTPRQLAYCAERAEALGALFYSNP